MALASKALRTALIFGAMASVATTLPAHAIDACTGSYNFATIFSGSFTCQAGDKIYSKFINPQNLPSNFSLAITDLDPFHILTTGGTYAPGTYSFGYTLAIDTALTPNRYIANFTTDFQLAGSPGQVLVGVKTLQAFSPNAGPAIATRVAGIAPAPLVDLPVGTQTVDFVTTLLVEPGQVATGITDTVFQAEIPDSVPGPLPLLGAAAAFGLSRKLRRRISQSV